ncbi:MAG: hypothetical protein HN718_14375 [Rhodospirillales bacterium]|jgi:hypothetical protein|nr:hypothetical protein [Rhodospirillales bacterium]
MDVFGIFKLWLYPESKDNQGPTMGEIVNYIETIQINQALDEISSCIDGVRSITSHGGSKTWDYDKLNQYCRTIGSQADSLQSFLESPPEE